MPRSKQTILNEIEQLKKDKPTGWKNKVIGLCRLLYRMERPDRAELLWQYTHPAPFRGDRFTQRLGMCPGYDRMGDDSRP